MRTTKADGKQQTSHGPVVSAASLDDLDGLPSDAFDSSPDRAVEPGTRRSGTAASTNPPRLLGQQSFRQTTLWGGTVEGSQPIQSQGASNRVYRGDLPPEAPTHHSLHREALQTWVYPTNLGPIRDYQFSIVKNGLFNNTLVALPTGLGKTFIAATVILNYYRWTANAKIVFVAPTKPLAAQQVDACLNVAGIPRSQATLLTGETAPALREEEWASKRLFFMTPQTLQNDLGRGYADPKSIVLLVIDEAHRATGDYAYVKVVEFIRRFSKSFRVLALTATPGSSIEGVQEVIDNLGVSHVEIRTEESIDIRQYVHSRQIERVVLEPSEDIMHVRELFSKALKPICDKLSGQNIWYGRDPMALTTYGLVKARQEWMNGPARHLNQGTKFMIMAIFSILQSVAHSIKLLNFHGIKPFYDNMQDFRSSTEEKGDKGSKYKRQLIGDPNFQELMDTIEKWLRIDGFVSHPKVTYLCDNLLNHFMDAGEGSNTRAIVFSEYRDSAEEIVRTLNEHKPLISAAIFVGQADSKRSAGMKQKQQIETIEKFRNGAFNVLVATSIGEEGLDIGQVDLIICYDASSSPIRMLQRMGRTGRKRAGNIILLLMKGKEEDKFAEAQDNYAQMQKLICEGSRFNFRHDLSSRIVPRDCRPEVEKCFVEIPIENTQTSALPEPKKSNTRAKKKPSKKKFHMPDGVETGFTKASSLFGRPTAQPQAAKPKEVGPVETDFLADIPDLESVLLTAREATELDRLYRNLPFQQSEYEEISAPYLGAHPESQRILRPAIKLKHGEYTRRVVRLFRTLGESQSTVDRYAMPYGEKNISRYRLLPVPSFADEARDEDFDSFPPHANASNKRPKSNLLLSDDDEEEEDEPQPKRQKPRAKSQQKTKPRGKQQKRRNYLSEASEGMSEDDAEEDDPASSVQTTHRNRRTAAKKSQAPRRRNYDNLEERGDDCMRTSDNYESDGSDSGADLEGFIIGDDEVTSSMRREIEGTATSPTTASPPSTRVAHRARRKEVVGGGQDEADDDFFVPTYFPPTQATDDDMPEITDLAGTNSRQTVAARGVRSGDGEGGGDAEVVSRPRAKKRRQIFIDDSDSD